MKNEYTPEDFARGVRNPYFEKLARKVEVTIKHDDYKIYFDIAEQNGCKPEDIMRRCLADYAKLLQEHGK